MSGNFDSTPNQLTVNFFGVPYLKTQNLEVGYGK
jgi:hypothetical protein